MRRATIFLSVICITAGLLLTAGIASSAETISIKVSPNTITLGSVGEWVTVHTDIALSLVDTSSISLNGVDVAWTKADAKGNLVAKFVLEDIKAIVEPPEATLSLLGSTKDGEEFTGSDTVAVH
jgi:hypothetical protein